MALDAYITFTGLKQGQFRGNNQLRGLHAGKSVLVGAAFNHATIAPIDPSHMVVTGRRQYQPITIWKEVDAASPQLFAALGSKELLTGKIELVKAGHGSQKPNCTLKLSGGVISSIERVPSMTKGTHHHLSFNLQEYEKIKMIFQTIDGTYNDGGVSMQDSWNAKV